MSDKQKILIADNDPETTTALMSILKSKGFEVLKANDAAFVLTMALRNKPDAVVLGAGLPAGGSLQALRRLRGSVHTADIPVIGLTLEGGAKQELLTAGIEACLDMPLDVSELLNAVESQLGIERQVEGAPKTAIENPERLAALDDTQLMDTDPDEDLDLITHLAARLLNIPVALVSLVDDHRQFFKSQVGLPEPWSEKRETPLSHSFCQWVVSSDRELVISDARNHPVLVKNGAVSDLGVIAYAGVPLKAQTGNTIGAFCAIDSNPYDWSDKDLATLRDCGLLVDAYTALNQSSVDEAGPNPTENKLSQVSKAVARGYLGASRLLRRHGHLESERGTVLDVIHSQSQQLIERLEAVALQSSEPVQPANVARLGVQ